MIIKIHNSQNEVLISLLDEKVASELREAKSNDKDGVTEYNLSDELCESMLDELTGVLMLKGMDSDGNINSIGIDVEQYIDLFNQQG